MSTANYVIICEGRIDVITSKDTTSKIKALSRVATNLVSHIDLVHPGQLAEADVKPISDLQHELMDNALLLSKDQVEAYATTMFELLEELEDKFATS